MTPRLIISLFLCLPLAAEDGGFLILKTGERFATNDRGKDVLADLGGWLAPRVGKGTLSGRLTNDPKEALDEIGTHPPLFAVVTPAFFLEHEQALGLVPLSQAKRNGAATEKYTVVVHQGKNKAPISSVSTSLAAEEKYLRKVVFPDLAAKWEFARSSWVGDDVVALALQDSDAPPAVLLDRAQAEFFRKDETTWKGLSVAFESEELPPDVVVSFKTVPEETRKKLAAALLSMKEDAAGKKVCESLQTDGFGAVDEKLWAKARERWAK